MAGLVVADTDLLVDFLRGRGAGTALIRQLITDRRLRLTAVTGFELSLGTDFLPRLPLAAPNRRHFERVDGLRLVDLDAG